MLPSKALLLFSELLHFEQLHTVLDLGCGTGRNAIYLAQKGCEVHAVDFSEAALKQLDSSARAAGVADRIHIHHAKLDAALCFTDNTFDLVLDSYVSCHFTDDRLLQHYLSELYRVLKPTGNFFSSQFSVEDEYYRPLLESNGQPPALVRDPHNGITKRLYTESEVKAVFAQYFNLRYFLKFEFQDVVINRPYLRSILVLILEK